jgi:3-hydroxyacyl-[acyl-carrier-protein] dehydratase
MVNILTQQLYTNLIKEENEVLVTLADSSHPIFKAHFEGNPLLPGFMQVDIAAEILGITTTGITRSKFMEPLLPNDELILQYEERSGKIRVRWIKNDKIASEMTLETE